ncbi:hypothetical protein CFE70_001686 [Pyrenophora teres f. teres 0-1]
MENITSASSDMEAVGGGIPRATAAFTAMTWYNSIELLFLVFFTFKKYSGAYMKQNNVAHDTHVDNILMTVGLVLMVPGQSLVLYSRLHLISSNQKLVRSILWMIIVLAVVLCVPTSMLNLREYTDQPGTYTRTYSAMAKTQMTLSSFEEVFISCVYIWETRNAMRVNFNALDRKWMWQLIAMNIFLLVMDTALLVMEFLELYMILNTFKSLVHSFKLKIEFAVLTQMVRKAVPPSASKFIEVGIEIVSCAICHDTFTDEHIAIQIIACGHQFGTLPPIFASDAPVSPTRFIEYYGQTLNVRRSAQDGFLSRLWSGIMNPPPGDQVTCAVRVIMLAFEEFPGPEYNALMRYISRISSIGLQATWSTCLITSLVNTLSYFARCCQKGFTLSLATWQAIMRYQLHAGNDTLNWLEIRNAAWTLHGLHSEGRSTGEHWYKLHLFFVLLGIHRSQQRLPVYGARELRELIHILGCDDPFGTLGQDGATRLFLLAAMHVLELSKIFDRPCRDARGLRLLNENTSRQLLKQDVEALWLEGMTLAAKEMAEGRPIL